MDPASALLLFALFKATEKVIGYGGGKVADAMSKPIWDALEEKARWLAGESDTARRWQAFTAAFEEANERFVSQAPQPEVARQVSRALVKVAPGQKVEREQLQQLAEKLEQAALVLEKPDIEAITELCMVALRQSDRAAPPRPDVADALAVFITAFQKQLALKPAYREWLKQQLELEQLLAERFDGRDRYLSQFIKYHQDLDFVGIPELRDRQTLRVKDIFIHLQAEPEQEFTFQDTKIHVIDEAHSSSVTARFTEYIGLVASLDRPGNAQYGITLGSQRAAVREVLAQHERIVVLGDPGAGKTTLLKYISLLFAQGQGRRLGVDEERLPVFVRLYDFVARQDKRQNDYSLVEYLYTQARENLQLRLEPGFFERALERGECIVCLDGLDELGEAGVRREMTSAVASFAHRYTYNRFIVTSRRVGYNEAPLDSRDFVHYRVLPFEDEDIKRFVKKWYTAREKDPTRAKGRAEHLTQTIMNEPRIKSLATNPLLLTIIALVHRIEAELPHERVKLYEKCVGALVDTWERVKRLRRADRERPYYRLRRRLLEQLAYWMHTRAGEENRSLEVREGDLELQVTHFLLENPKLQLDDEGARQEAHAFVKLAKSRTGLLVERGEGIYSFAHLTFQEYLTAADIERRLAHSIDAMWAEIQPHLHDPHWLEVILLLLGSLNKFEEHPTALVQHIYEMSDDYEPVLHRHLFLVTQAMADHVDVDAVLRDEIVDQLLAIIHSDEPASDDALEILGLLKGNRRATVGLLTLVGDEKVNAWVRDRAARSLGQLRRTAEEAETLLALAQDEKTDVWMRGEAARALGHLAYVGEKILLGLSALGSDNDLDTGLRRAAIYALGQLGYAAEWVLLDLLALSYDGEDIGVRIVAAQALGRLERTDAASEILLALALDENLNDEMRVESVYRLGQLELYDESVLQNLLKLVQDDGVNFKVRREAAYALGQLGHADEGVLFGLLVLLHDEGDIEVQRAAVYALGLLGHAEDAVLSGLVALVQDEGVHSMVRGAAAYVLGRLGRADELVLSAVLSLARDEGVQPWERGKAAYALGQLRRVDEVVLSTLLTLARDERFAGVRYEAAHALGKLGQADEAVKMLLALVKDEGLDASVRREAASALGQLGQIDPMVLSGLLTLARDKGVGAGASHAAYRSLKALLGEATRL